jgi:pilus assembly protein Flp/PilA
MQNLKQIMNNLIVEESGQDLIEYALVAALVGLGAVASMKSLAGAINGAFNTVTTALTSNV